jgi:SWI/SNF-related matrix-associated actin-dependent regulator 1 of chromatin subfamily A
LEIKKWVLDIKDEDIKIFKKSEKEIEFLKINIISYNLACKENILKKLIEEKFNCIICDESHFLKSDKTNRTKSIQNLIKNSNRIILLR